MPEQTKTNLVNIIAGILVSVGLLFLSNSIDGFTYELRLTREDMKELRDKVIKLEANAETTKEDIHVIQAEHHVITAQHSSLINRLDKLGLDNGYR
jgi:chromosome segregation ATPase